MAELKIRAEHLNPFITATIETFTTMVRTKATPGKVHLKSGNGLSYDVSGIIGLSGGAQGSVALSFPKDSAIAIAKSFIDQADISPEAMVDCVGELANIIAGAAKKGLAQYKISISLPTVVTGSGHGINGPVDTVNMVIPFESGLGRFDLAICFKSLT